jgi:hypothetical protein
MQLQLYLVKWVYSFFNQLVNHVCKETGFNSVSQGGKLGQLHTTFHRAHQLKLMSTYDSHFRGLIATITIYGVKNLTRIATVYLQCAPN